MSVDDLLNSALHGRSGALQSSDIFALVGDSRTGEMFVLNLKEFFSENFAHFLQGERPSGILIGAYYKEEDAYTCMDLIRAGEEQGPGLIYAPEWQVLLWKARSNELCTFPLWDYYVGFLSLFRYQIDSGMVILDIYTTTESAEDIIDFIRLYIKNGNGNIIY